ncbi:hypothetical protein BH20ACI4_BH20ACI4_11230 [soil metagenome]
MNIFRLQTSDLKIRHKPACNTTRGAIALFLFFGISALSFWFGEKSAAQTITMVRTPATNYRVGEHLTYSFSFERFNNVAFAELFVASRGKLEGKDAVELYSKFKTVNFLSAAFYLIDETRTTFASTENGLPLYTQKVSNAGVLPQEEVKSFLTAPAVNFDLLTMLYQARNAGGIGNFQFQENGRVYNANFTPMGNERVKTDAGDFETAISTVQSDFLTENGIKELKINFSVDDQRIPVLMRFKTDKGEFRGSLSSHQVVDETPGVTPTPNQTPIVTATPKPIATPTPYIENQPLLPELPFVLGETLFYQVSNNNLKIALITLQAKERKLFLGEDSLLLTATVTGIEPSNQIFNLNDGIRAQVSPESLAPKQIDFKFSGFFAAYNQTTTFDQKTGTAIYDGTNRMEIPVGTHSILSLVYAIRSFNLKPSKDETNPINDTRVAVFLGSQPFVFTLRPENADLITQKGEKISAQLITVITGNPSVDTQGLRIWLSNDLKRTPLRLTFGTFQADLISQTVVTPK